MAEEIKDLIVAESISPEKIVNAEDMDALLADIDKKVRAFVFDAKTPAGRKDTISLAYKITRSKTLIDTMLKEHSATLRNKVKAIDAQRKKARTYLDDLSADVRDPVTKIEEAEEKADLELKRLKKVQIENRVKELADLGAYKPYGEIAVMTDEDYDTAVFDAHEADLEKQEQDERVEAERKETEEKQRIENERLKKVKAEQEKAAEKLRLEQVRIDKERADFEAEKKRVADEKQAEEDRKEKEKVEAETRLWMGRLEQLNGVVWNAVEAVYNDVVLATYENLVSWNDEQFNNVRDSHNADVREATDKKEEQERIENEKIVKDTARHNATMRTFDFPMTIPVNVVCSQRDDGSISIDLTSYPDEPEIIKMINFHAGEIKAYAKTYYE